jgi:hypothetical protein
VRYLLGGVAAADPRMGSNERPQDTDEASFHVRHGWRLPAEAFPSQVDVSGVDLDAEPVPPVTLSHLSHGSGTHEGIEDEARSGRSAAGASGLKWSRLSKHSPPTWIAPHVGLNRRGGLPHAKDEGLAGGGLPRGPAIQAHLDRTGSQERALNESYGEGGKVCPLEAGRRNPPDITGILAEKVTGNSGQASPVESGVRSGKGSSPVGTSKK